MNVRGDIAPRIFKLDTRWRLIGELEVPVALAREKEPPVPFGKRVVALHTGGEGRRRYIPATTGS